MHNAAFKSLGLDASYEIFDMDRGDVGSLFRELKDGKVDGFNVTIPYKEFVLDFLDSKSEEVEFTGASNTVLLDGNKKAAGYNTDCAAFKRSLEKDLEFTAGGKRVFLFGSGGAAKACSYALKDALEIIVTDIDDKKAKGLVSFIKEKSGCKAFYLPVDDNGFEGSLAGSELIVNATPCGMKESDGELFDYSRILKKQAIFDLIYAVDTRLVQAARDKGLRAVNGLNMLLYQGARAFNIWTGIDAPIDVMKRALGE